MDFLGLSDKEVDDSRSKSGSNKIIESEPEKFWNKFLAGFGDPMIKLLLVIVAVMTVMWLGGHGEIYEPHGTLIAVLLVTTISARTEMASDKEYRRLKDSTKKETAKVYRNGKISVIDIDDLVVGDKIILQSGDKIPADGILISGDLRVDNSALNGEAEECKKFAVPSDFEYVEKQITGDIFVDKHSLFRGAVTYNGEGVMEVKQVGMQSMMGKMAEDMKDDEVMSPLKVKLSKLAHQISMFGYIGSVVIAVALIGSKIFAAGGFDAYWALGGVAIFSDVLAAVTLAIVIVVCAVPEGLPLMISLVLMQNTSKMLRHNVLVRKPIGIETAGSLNILYSDKTGTITKGQLEVVEFFGGSAKTINPKENKNIGNHLDLAICKNTSAMFDDEHRIIGGNATDKALLGFMTEDVFTTLHEDKNLYIIKSQGFNSTNKFSQSNVSGKTYYKGAPERLLAKAVSYVDENGEIKPINIDVLNAKIDELAKRAMRVLSFGYSNKDLTEDSINDDLVIVGFVGIRDDVRQEAKEAIEIVKKAGIQVVMITGDRKETAVAIAKEAGLLQTADDLSYTSDELNSLTDDQIKAVLPRIRVIARALPTDKSRMVRLSQELNLVCGMTGDGVNDAPALKRADVGFAMGSGTDVAKEAGDIVILDDNFKSIKDAILYGRTIYHNIIKFCKFQLVINVSAVGISAIAPFIGIDSPLKVTHLLWINLVMDALGSLALGNEPALEEYLLEKPRRRDENMITKPILIQLLIMGAWVILLSLVFLLVPFFRELFPEGPLGQAQFMTAYFSMFILSAVFNGFNVRSEGIHIFERIKENPGFIKIMAIIVFIQILLTIFGGEFFTATPFGIKGWVVITIMAVTMIPVDMIRKTITNRKQM